MLCLKTSEGKKSGGFTLIEVVIALVVTGIFAAMIVTFMSTGVVKSVNPVITARDGNYLNSIMENMYADYKYQMFNAVLNGQTPATAFSVFESHVDTPNYYSSASQPYTVVKKRISFTGNPPQEQEDAGSKILKVIITYKDLSVAQIFTE